MRLDRATRSASLGPSASTTDQSDLSSRPVDIGGLSPEADVRPVGTITSGICHGTLGALGRAR